jgi:hypothetical protein
MIRKYWLTYSFVVGAALLQWQGTSLSAQATNYSISVSPLPAQAGQPLTVTVPVPTTVPDGTPFTLMIYTTTFPANQAYDPPVLAYSASGISLNHIFTLQTPALTAGEQYNIIVIQTGSVSIATNGSSIASSSVALGPANISVVVPALGQGPITTPLLAGNYSFLFQGQTNGAQGKPNGVAAAGTFSADGRGNISSATADLNDAVGVVVLAGPEYSGTYQIDATGKGTILLNTSPVPLSFNFFVPDQPGVIINNGSIAPVNSGLTGSGEFSVAGNVFETATDSAFDDPVGASVEFAAEISPGAGFTVGAGLLTFDRHLAQEILTSTGQVTTGLPDGFTGNTGQFNFQSQDGTDTLLFSVPGQPSTAPANYAVYEGSKPSGGVFYFLSTDPHPATNLIVGKAEM